MIFVIGWVGALTCLVVSLLIRLCRWTYWESLPTFKGYLKRYPHCRTDRGVKCRVCNSRSIRHWGTRTRRTFTCNHCGTNLYRK